MKTLYRWILGLLLLLGTGLNLSCISQPNIMGRKTMTLMPDSLLNQQASAAYTEEKKKNPITKNTQHDVMVKRVGQRLIAIVQKDYPETCQGFNWEINVFDQPKTVNAYAMPGGKIAFYSGILPVCQNEAGIAAVMGHEVSHALLRHGNERVTRQLMVQGLLVGTAAAVGSAKVQDETKRIIMASAGVGANLGLVLPFSRKHESEADHLGVLLMAKAGYDPAEAAQIWVRMTQMSGGQQQPEFLSTHPSHGRRITDLTTELAEARPLYEKSPTKYGKGEALKF